MPHETPLFRMRFAMHLKSSDYRYQKSKSDIQ
jgi:hypothetical protein